MDELTCKEVVELITEYLEGALPAEERLRLERHLVYCPGCATYVDQMRRTIDTVGQLCEEPIPAELEQGFVEIFRTWKASDAPETA